MVQKLLMGCVIATGCFFSTHAQETICDDFTEWPSAEFTGESTIGLTQDDTYDVTALSGSHGNVNGWIPGIGGGEGDIEFEMSGAEQIAEFTIAVYSLESLSFSVNGSSDIEFLATFPMTVDEIDIELELIETLESISYYSLRLEGELDNAILGTLESSITKLCVTTGEEGDGTASIKTNENTSFKIYPNPTQGLLTINSSEEISTVRVFDLAGSLVMETAVSGETVQINLEAVPSGIYLAQINFAGGEQELIKITRR